MLGKWSNAGFGKVPAPGEDGWLTVGSWNVAGADGLPIAGEATKG